MADLPIPGFERTDHSNGCNGLDGCDSGSGVADGAAAVASSDAKNALLASIEARLAQEVLRLIGPVQEFGRRAQLIGKEIPDSAQFCKLITGFIGLSAFQLAYAIRQMADTPIFVDDGREYLAKLGLQLHDVIREVDLDGRRFLAIALIDQKAAQFGNTLSEGDK